MERLGLRIWILALSLEGKKENQEWMKFLVEAARVMEMEAAADPAIWLYPLGGKGGYGATIVQPITDSFLALDTWPDHNGVYFFINSCKPFNQATLLNFVEEQGLNIIDSLSDSIGLSAWNMGPKLSV